MGLRPASDAAQHCYPRQAVLKLSIRNPHPPAIVDAARMKSDAIKSILTSWKCFDRNKQCLMQKDLKRKKTYIKQFYHNRNGASFIAH